MGKKQILGGAPEQKRRNDSMEAESSQKRATRSCRKVEKKIEFQMQNKLY
jgi:hypothetical protein